MAELVEPVLTFLERGLRAADDDPGLREVDLPSSLPTLGDDFDWSVRDYEGFRDFMLNELKARFPERQRWTPADMELVLIEVLATALDHLSDMADRAAAESSLLTCRRGGSMERWLRLIGMDPAGERFPQVNSPKSRSQKLHTLYRSSPHEMERDRRRGPSTIRRQERMVSLDDYGERLSEHPLIFRSRARHQWRGTFLVVWVTVMLHRNIRLDEAPPLDYPPLLVDAVEAFHSKRGLFLHSDWTNLCTIRDLLGSYVESYRTTGQVVFLEDVAQVGLNLALKVRIRPEYYQSEIRYEVMRALGRGPGGFFEPGRFTFGQDVPASDLFELLMDLEGIEDVRLTRFRRTDDSGHAEVTTAVQLKDHEVAICDNDSRSPERGIIHTAFSGGRIG